MADPQDHQIQDYVKPSEAQLRAQKKRNIAIAVGVAAFMAFVFLTIVLKFLGADA